MFEEKRDGGAELLEETHLPMDSHYGGPLVGWVPNSQGTGGLNNPKGWASIRTVLWKMVDGAKAWLYDQQMLVENPGAIVICQLGDRIGLVQNYRMVGDRILPLAGSDYVRCLQDESLWKKLVEGLGAWKWECPRGLVHTPPGDLNVEEFVLNAAKLEALQEAGFTIAEACLVGRVNVNPTFFCHSQWVVFARIEAIGETDPEDLEIIGKAKLFTLDQIDAMIESGELDDGLTLAGLGLCAIKGLLNLNRNA